MAKLACAPEDSFEDPRVQDPGSDAKDPNPANDPRSLDPDFDSGQIGPGMFSPWPLVAPATNTARNDMKGVRKNRIEKEQQ